MSITTIGGRMGSISTPDRRMRRGEILQASAMRDHTRALAGLLQRWDVPLEHRILLWPDELQRGKRSERTKDDEAWLNPTNKHDDVVLIF